MFASKKDAPKGHLPADRKHRGRHFWFDVWNIFDAILVLFSLVDDPWIVLGKVVLGNF